MRPVLQKLLLAALLTAAGSAAQAQFVVDGTEKASVSWHQIKTDDYRFVYPSGIDSLARVYAQEWERWKLPVARSIGRVPNEGYRLRMPVVLHPYLGYSNGMVVWTPRRMEMYTGPDMASPDPLAWETLLSIHEQRHVAQMQFLRERPIRFWSTLTGEALAGFFSIWYFDPAHYEGDAVAVETGLTQSGRARTADFLEYYRASFDEGQFRNYERWRYGSQRLYTPDYYKLGYLAIGGMRAVYDKPLFMQDYYDWKLPYRRQVRRQTHMKFKEAFGGVMAVQDSLWRTDDSLRAPYQPMERLTSPGRYYVSYSGLAYSDGKIYARQAGIADDVRIVAVDTASFEVDRIRFTGADSPLSAGDGRLFWSEVSYDPRWEMHSHSSVRYLDDSGIHTLKREGRWFNPKAFGDTLAMCRTDYDGSAYVALMSASDGSVLEEFRAPGGMTPYEAVIKGGEVFCAAVTKDGEGIYRLPSFTPVLAPSFVMINHLFVREGKIFFTSDRTGVNELYSLEDGGVVQHTQLKAGGKDFVFGEDGQLYFTYLRTDGRMIYRTPVDSLPARSVDFTQRHRYELEDRLSAQEAALAAAAPADTAAPRIGAPRRYSKALHAVKVHSWMPFYVDYDELSDMSYESVTTDLGLGATVFFQNDLNTLYGIAGYSYVPGLLLDDGLPLHSGMVNLTYRGLFPVIEGKFTYNRLGLSTRLRSYIPLSFSSDGWTRAVVPIAEFNYSPLAKIPWLGVTRETASATVGIRAYSVLPTLNSCYFPHWGIGGSLSVTNDVDYPHPLFDASVYAYMPGLWKTSGLGISASYSTEPYATPGVTDPSTLRLINDFGGITMATSELRVNYAIPFLSVDWNGLSPLVYLRNFEFIPKASFTHYELLWDKTKFSLTGNTSVNMWTAGAALDMVLGNFWFIPYKFRLGVSAVYVHGNPDPEAKPYEINVVFSVDL